MTPPRETLHEETPDFGATFKCEAKPEHVHNHPLFDLHEETLGMLNAEADALELRSRNRRVSESSRVYAEGRMERFAYAAQCVKDVQALREQVADAERVAKYESDVAAQAVADLAALRAENARLAEKIAALDAMDFGRVEIMRVDLHAPGEARDQFVALDLQTNIGHRGVTVTDALLAYAQATGRTDAS